MKSEKALENAMEQYGDMVYRVCYLYMKQKEDAEDIFQTVFCRYLTEEREFESAEHEKAWLLRVAVNLCKDTLLSFFRKKVCSLDELEQEFAAPEEEGREVRFAVLKLPEKYRLPVYLFYFEGYSAVEIGRMLGKKENTIYTWLARGRKLLREELGGERFEEGMEESLRPDSGR
jgi:RNA polymerase sigma factor (sigma-70 family)